ncbi:uncharacterized protein PFL1_01821 [Pseudozyma flocculosa PF-1]|uniref:ER to Golgi transport-related protein n=1 Tax=Pseudozyma flocculosa TaxID=84751 RepID=A0A5C3EXT2_9BASI|nr:uncharacterized protein PFL1_01821 [Pseudozyma flocculosa PF-1]EPQ30923.1 hypothetical protein PFL1_01821 [Pseudozyma flocculosa PF-1]SPO36690.1 uncharacterized protein PSFLO_02161 [Pseudozyma flocculosa]
MSDLLDTFDKMPKIRQFDAFPKTQSIYTQRSSRGGLLTVVVSCLLCFLLWTEFSEYLYGERAYSFHVDDTVSSSMQINIDMTVAMQCHYLTIDVRDAVGDRLHVSEREFTKDGTTFEIGHAGRLDALPMPDLSVDKTISAAKRKSFLPSYSKRPQNKKFHKQPAFQKTAHVVQDGPACRIYGSMEVKRVSGNLHITTLGHGYGSFEHTAHELMNLSHVVHEFSFGPYFPLIAQPLDSSVEITKEHFTVFQYFTSVVPTLFIDSRGRRLKTHQYSVTDYSRNIEHGAGVPGIFIKYDIEPIVLTVRERSTTLVQFLVRLAGVVGGVWVCVGYAFRTLDRLGRVAKTVSHGGRTDDSPEGYAASYGYQRPSHIGGLTVDRRSTSSGWLNGGADTVEAMKQKWAGLGQGGAPKTHRKVDSVQQRIFSEEGRAW